VILQLLIKITNVSWQYIRKPKLSWVTYKMQQCLVTRDSYASRVLAMA